MAAQLEQDELDLASQGLTALPLALAPTLRVLSLTRNRLADLSPCGALRHLERLDVSRNKIRILPDTVASLPQL